jgi:hypothetical protein
MVVTIHSHVASTNGERGDAVSMVKERHHDTCQGCAAGISRTWTVTLPAWPIRPCMMCHLGNQTTIRRSTHTEHR